MIKPHELFIVLLLVVIALLCGCSGPYNGPTIGTVGVGGSYTSKDGETYGGNVNVGLDYPPPTPKPVDRSK